MNANVGNLIFVAVALLFCCKYPRAGVILTVVAVLFLPISFPLFGFALGSGDKYVPNLFIIGVFYTAYHFMNSLRTRRSGSALLRRDLAILAFIVVPTIVTALVTHFTFNPGTWIKQFAIMPLFYFMGRVYFSRPSSSRNQGVGIRNCLLVLGPYLVFFSLLEYQTGVNVHALALRSFAEFAGSTVISDPLQLLAAHRSASYYRVLGPQIEASEAAMVSLISFVGYLCWTDVRSRIRRGGRYLMLASLSIMMLLGGTRSVLVSLALVLIANELYGALRRGWVLLVYAVLGVAGLCLAAIDPGGLTATAESRFRETTFYSERLMDRSLEDRLMVWTEAIAVIKDNLLLGIGIGTPVSLLGAGASRYTSHNFYLDIILFEGLIVGAGIVTVYARVIRTTTIAAVQWSDKRLRTLGKTHVLLIAGTMAFYCASPEKLQSSALFWLYGGMIASAGRTSRQRSLLITVDAYQGFPAISNKPAGMSSPTEHDTYLSS